MQAAARPDVRVAVAGVYEQLQDDIDVRRPICGASGNCCRFDEYGHRLYVTTLELAAFVHEVGDAPGIETSGCPFQRGGLCSVHPIRPFGCRIFFCDATARDWQHEHYERYHARLTQLHDELNVPYFYVEWRDALRQLNLPKTRETPEPAALPAGKQPLSLPQLPF
jgi:Fe-S-cluster containining protein